MGVFYTRQEVVWLLGISREQAIEYDASQRDSLAGLTTNGPSTHQAGDGELPAIVRWHDIQAARRRITDGKHAQYVLEHACQGESTREIARAVGVSHMTVHRRFKASLDELLAELGADSVDEALSILPTCLIGGCGGPRVRLEPVLRRVKGGWKTVLPERVASVCAEHLRPDFVGRLAA